jgi:hypothetical protein
MLSPVDRVSVGIATVRQWVGTNNRGGNLFVTLHDPSRDKSRMP